MSDDFHVKVKVGDMEAKGQEGFCVCALEKCWLQAMCEYITFAARRLRLLIILMHR